MCWTRYERKLEKEKATAAADQQTCDNNNVGIEATTTTTPSSQFCTRVWEKSDYTDEDLRGKIDFIAQGCEYNDAVFERMLARAHDQCHDEIFAESTSATIIVYPRGMLTHINMLSARDDIMK